MILQMPVHASGMELPPLVDLKGYETEIASGRYAGTFDATGTALRVTEFYVAHYRQKALLSRANQINEREIPLRDTGDAHVLSIVQYFCAYGFDHARGTLSATTGISANRSEGCEGVQ